MAEGQMGFVFCGHLKGEASARNVRVRKHTGNVKNGWMKVSNICAYTLGCVTYSVRRHTIASSHAKEKVTFQIMPCRIVRTTLKELYTLNFAYLIPFKSISTYLGSIQL